MATSRARPSFLYVMYALILFSVPMGVIAAFDPAAAEAIGEGMTSYLVALPEALYALLVGAAVGNRLHAALGEPGAQF